MMRTQLLLLLGLLIMVGCSSDGEQPMEVIFDIDPEFQSYVDDFVAEGAKRGQTIDFSDTGLTVKFSELALTRADGRCFLASHRVEIDKARWNSFSPAFRTYLMFHELGHCELRRGHTNEAFDDESWKSIMKGDPFQNFEIRRPVPYFGFRREYYIDELFDENITRPEWGSLTFDFDRTDLQTEEVFSLGDINRFNRSPDIAAGEDYEIVVDFDLLTEEGTITKFEWGVLGKNYFIQVFPGFGFYAGVRDEGVDIFLHYSNNITRFNGEVISNITIRRHDGYEQIFINGKQFFLLDTQDELEFIALDALRGDIRQNQFDIQNVVVRRIL